MTRHCSFAALLLVSSLLVAAAPATIAHAQETSEADASETLRPERVEQRIFRQINRYREEHELPELKKNEDLREAAQKFARYMAETSRYGHTADGRRPVERAEAAGYAYCVVLENIAYQLDTRGLADNALAEEFTRGWIDSEEHRENILNRSVTETGIAIACTEDEERCYAVQMFGRPESARLVTVVENRSETMVRYRMVELERSRQPLTVEEGDASQQPETNEQREASEDRQIGEFELPPRLIRKHAVCVPSRLEILTFDASIKIDSDARLTVVREGGSLKLEQEPLEEDEAELEFEEG